MPSKTDTRTSESTLGSSVRTLFSIRNIVMLCAGVLAGGSLSFLGTGDAFVPFFGSVPGTLTGALGLVVALAVFQWGRCCDTCGTEDCGCTGECGDRCPHDP
jgi:hypothetical protein